MNAHSLVHHDRARHITRNGLLKLGWFHFWLLACTLAGMLALVALVFFADLASR